MYQNHKDLLQYNDNFNNYVTHQTVQEEELENFHASLNSINTRLHGFRRRDVRLLVCRRQKYGGEVNGGNVYGENHRTKGKMGRVHRLFRQSRFLEVTIK